MPPSTRVEQNWELEVYHWTESHKEISNQDRFVIRSKNLEPSRLSGVYTNRPRWKKGEIKSTL